MALLSSVHAGSRSAPIARDHILNERTITHSPAADARSVQGRRPQKHPHLRLKPLGELALLLVHTAPHGRGPLGLVLARADCGLHPSPASSLNLPYHPAAVSGASTKRRTRWRWGRTEESAVIQGSWVGTAHPPSHPPWYPTSYRLGVIFGGTRCAPEAHAAPRPRPWLDSPCAPRVHWLVC